jgi:hypothetical protein
MLSITQTSIQTIDDNALGNAKFGLIFIENNTLLETISDKVFANQEIGLLMIRYKNKLSPNSLFGLARYLKSVETLSLEYNNITEIPENAFNNGKDINIYGLNLNNNKISKIGLNAFVGLKNLHYVQIEFNNMTVFDDWLYFSPDPNLMRSVMLDNNQFSEKSFSENALKNKENIFLRLFLQNNKLTKFPENVFSKFFANGKNIMLLEGNNFECDCGMKWLLDNKPTLENRVWNLMCVNKNNANIFTLTPSDLGCNQ